ncbi:unnamed protein product [Moneuplotes crassus]|uniref:Uncharacterized protein n=1 Tax=Euplotes crassus TaxID=5936 RepID=A0AAD1UMZ4_EUPCR|nr:unnamed protein product [Moneuplotes crassus]
MTLKRCLVYQLLEITCITPKARRVVTLIKLNNRGNKTYIPSIPEAGSVVKQRVKSQMKTMDNRCKNQLNISKDLDFSEIIPQKGEKVNDKAGKIIPTKTQNIKFKISTHLKRKPLKPKPGRIGPPKSAKSALYNPKPRLNLPSSTTYFPTITERKDNKNNLPILSSLPPSALNALPSRRQQIVEKHLRMKAEQEKLNFKPKQDTLNEIIDDLPTSFNGSDFLPQDLFCTSFDSLCKENVELEANFEISEILNSNRKPAKKREIKKDEVDKTIGMTGRASEKQKEKIKVMLIVFQAYCMMKSKNPFDFRSLLRIWKNMEKGPNE